MTPATATNTVATGLHGARDGLAWRTAAEDFNSSWNFRLCDTVQAPLQALFLFLPANPVNAKKISHRMF